MVDPFESAVVLLQTPSWAPVTWYPPPEHGDFIFDARLLPLQRFFRDTLDCHHLSRGLLPSHHHFRKRTAAKDRKRNMLVLMLHMRSGNIDTENLSSVSR